jgi:hypothetical protein
MLPEIRPLQLDMVDMTVRVNNITAKPAHAAAAPAGRAPIAVPDLIADTQARLL